MEQHHLTGHHEIDEQHRTLGELTHRLDIFCRGSAEATACCVACPGDRIAACAQELAQLLGELLSFMVDHFTYEERLMRLLPDNKASREHQQAHKRAHADISAHLSQLAVELDRQNPRQAAARLHEIIAEWMGNHTAGLDNELARELAHDAEIELHYDVELVQLLADAA